MKHVSLPASAIPAAGLLLGIAGNFLLHGSDGPGLNMLVLVAGAAGATLLLHVRSGRTVETEFIASLAIGVLFVSGMAWRDSPALKLLALGCAGVAFALPAMRAGAAWIRNSGVMEYIAALAGTAAHAGFGAALALSELDWSPADSGARAGTMRHRAAGVARGGALALPFIIVFGALFVAADAVFAGIVHDIVPDLETLTSHVLVTAFLAWIATGYLRGSLAGTRLDVLSFTARERPKLGITETATALALLDLLFLAFVIVQLRYLFGGSSLVEVTPGLTFAEYARRGFFELVAVAALVLPLLLAADWLLRRDTERDERVFRALAGLQILLVLAVTASALQRMRLYQEAYGLTELRVYVTAVLILIAVVLLWFAATVLRSRRRSFAFGALVAGFATVAVLYAVNPDALITRTNVARLQSGDDARVHFDARYATSLSADAVPALLAALPTLPEGRRCYFARRLLQRWVPDEHVSVRSWSWSAARARAEVRAHEGSLRRLAGQGESC